VEADRVDLTPVPVVGQAAVEAVRLSEEVAASAKKEKARWTGRRSII